MDVIGMMLSLAAGLQEFWNESFFVALLKFFLFVYVLVLLVDLRDLSADLKKVVFGAEKPLMSEKKARARWSKITERLESANDSQYKAAILEADAFASEILASIGYRGATMQEQLDQVVR